MSGSCWCTSQSPHQRASPTTRPAHVLPLVILVVLERPLWLTLMEIKDTDKCPLPGLTGLPHWPVRTLCGSSLWHRSHPRQRDTSCQSVPALQLSQVSPDLRWLLSLPRQRHRPPSQNPSLRLETDLVRLDTARLLAPRTLAQDCAGSSAQGVVLIYGQEEGGTRSRSCRTNPFSSGCRGQFVFCSHWARRSAQTAYRCYSRYD